MANLAYRCLVQGLTVFIFTMARAGFAAETDNFRGFSKVNNPNFPDAAPELERLLNDAIAETAREASRRHLPCGENGKQAFFELLLPKVACLEEQGRSPLEQWALENPAVAKLDTPFRGSIYDGSSNVDKRVQGLSPQIKLAGIPVGTDKLGHFIKQGSLYYQALSPRGSLANVAEVVQNIGVAGEEGLYGIASTGVKSYGDLAANYQGMRFWHNLLHGKNPHVSCAHGQFRLARRFSFKDYVNWAWNEAINCSEFNQVMGNNFRESGKHCPIKPDLCRIIRQTPNSQYFISPQCLYASGHRNQDNGPSNQFLPTINHSLLDKVKSKALSMAVKVTPQSVIQRISSNSPNESEPAPPEIHLVHGAPISREGQDLGMAPAVLGFAPSQDLAEIRPASKGPDGKPLYLFVYTNSAGENITYLHGYSGPLYTCQDLAVPVFSNSTPVPSGDRTPPKLVTLPHRMIVRDRNMLRITQCPRP